MLGVLDALLKYKNALSEFNQATKSIRENRYKPSTASFGRETSGFDGNGFPDTPRTILEKFLVDSGAPIAAQFDSITMAIYDQ